MTRQFLYGNITQHQDCGAATKKLGAVSAPALSKNPGAGAVSAPAPPPPSEE